MKLCLALIVVWICGATCAQSGLQTNYEYYTAGGIKSGLKADTQDFMLNGKKISLFSGSLHYFRLPQEYWKDRLLKFRAAGLNAVQTYSPWNLHEETPGHWDFETGVLNLRAFLDAVKEADMFVMYRIGPYMCGEWDLGGYPSWLLRDPHMRLRSNYKPHLEATEKFYKKVLAIIDEYQFTKGGPVIAMQFENEFGGIHSANDKEYFQFMKNTIEANGFKELLTNCDSFGTAADSVKLGFKDVLETDNFNTDSLKLLTALRKAQPNKPLYVSEFWPGWYDSWGEKQHHVYDVNKFEKEVTDVLFNANSSINFYMFFGGTNFGFMNGDTVVTSYDYDAPLSESGNYTLKYWKTKELIEKFVKERGLPQLLIPKPPAVPKAKAYGKVKVVDYLSLEDVLSKIKPIVTEKPTHMELLNLGPNYGQNYGFINYRLTNLQKFKHLKITGGASDRAVVLIDHNPVGLVDSTKDYELDLNDSQFANTTTHTLDIIVENTGRAKIGGGINTARKGLNGDVTIDGKIGSHFETFPIELKQQFVQQMQELKGKPFVEGIKSPSLYRLSLDIKESPSDTFVRLDGWTKGNVFVNGFNAGRYYSVGPQHTLYIPAPLLKSGLNHISVFELHSPKDVIQFTDTPDLGPV